MKLINYPKILFLFLVLFICLGSFKDAKAFEEKNKLGFFDNKPLQEILEKPFYLFGDNQDDAIPFYLKDFIEWDYQITYDSNYHSEIENPFINQEEDFSKNYYLELSQLYKEKLHYKKTSTIFLKENETKEFLNSIAKNINQAPIDGKFKIDENNQLSVLEKSQKGAILMVDTSYEKIKKSLLENP